MRKRYGLKCGLACSTIIGSLWIVQPAAAQTDSQLNEIQQQIRSLQHQLEQMKADIAARDRAVKAAQAQAKAAQDQATTATAAAQASATAAAQSAVTAAAAVPPPSPALPPGQFQVGGLKVTLGGFAAAESVYRSRNEGASVDTNFNAIPLHNSPNYHQGEFRESAQQSRFSLMVQGQIDDTQSLTSYLETDFLSAGTSSNNNQSNSYTLRLRQFWGAYDNTDWGLHVLGGQAWSLATMYKTGLVNRQENVPLTIDAQYVVGFNWERQAQFRVVQDFDDHKVWAGLSLEEPQTTFNGSAGPNCLTGANATTSTGGGTLEYTTCGGANVNTIQAYSDNIAPDIIAKIAADPGWGHYEVYGLLSFLGGRVSFASTGTGKSYQTTGEGIGAGMILPLVPKLIDFQVSGLIGQGVGRYGSSQLPDVTFSPTGKIEPLAAYSIMGGFVGHPTPAIDLYAYAGAEGVAQKTFGGTSGYGNPAANLSGCALELGTCSAVTSGIVEGTVGAWWRVFKSVYGTAEIGAQYGYINRNTFLGAGATKGSTIAPSTNENEFLFSVRYIPFS